MEVINTGGYTYLNLKNKFGAIENEQYFFLAKSGWGKGLATGGLVETLYNEGYIIIVVADPKDQAEFAFSMFEPKENYHLNELRKTGIRPSKIPCKLYHPFTFRLPTTLQPDMNIFTIPIKEMSEDEFSFLAETDSKTEAVRLLQNASENIPNNGGVYTFLHTIQDLVKGKKTGREYKAMPANWYLEATSGTLKSVTDASGIMQPFKIDAFLSSKANPLALDVKSILSDNKHYHVFLANHIPYKRYKKTRDFLVLSIVSQIITNEKFARHPVCLVFPEVGNQMPPRPEGHEKFLAKSLRRLITTCRSMGKGFTTISDNQTHSGIDEEYVNSSTQLLLGQLKGAKDVEKIVKSLGYKQDLRKRLLKPEYKNSFTLVGNEDDEFYLRFPSHMWAEARYTFTEYYAKMLPFQMRTYNKEIGIMKAEMKAEEEKYREKARRREEARKRESEEKKKERESGGVTKKAEEKVQKAKKIEDKAKSELMRLIYEAKQDNPELSARKLGDKFSVSHHTIKKYLKEYEEIAKEEEVKDFEESVVEDLEEPTPEDSI